MAKTGRLKTFFIIAAVVAVLAVAAVGISRVVQKDRSENVQSVYREYNVEKGNITVGTSESGTASIGRSYITFSADAEVEEIYVKVGSDVKEGDPVAKLNVDDIDDFKAQYESQIQAAKLELEAAENEKAMKLFESENTYSSAINSSNSAEEEYKLSVKKIEMELVSAEKNLESLKTQLEEYRELAKSYPDDNSLKSSYEDTYEKYKTEYSSFEKTLKNYEKELSAAKDDYESYFTDEIQEDWNELIAKQNAVEPAKEKLDAALEVLNEAQDKVNALGNSYYTSENSSENTAASTAEKNLESAQESYNKALKEYNEAFAAYDSVAKSRYDTIKMRKERRENAITEIEEKIETYKEMMSDYADKMNEYKEEYDDNSSDFNEKYGNLDEEEINDKIEKLESDIESAEYELEKLRAGKENSVFSAEKDMQTTLINAENAESAYELAVRKINDNISEKQENYDKLSEEYAELLENIGDGVYICADCDGAVSSVNIEAGDTVNPNMSVATIMDSSEVYVSVSVAETDISALSVGQAAEVVFSAYENITLDGEIDTIAVEPSRSGGSVTYEVTVKVNPNENVKIYEGMTCEITFIRKQVYDTVYVNIRAVEYKGNGISTVLVYDENGNAVEREVVTGFTDGRYVEILSGIEPGERVLAESAVSRE